MAEAHQKPATRARHLSEEIADTVFAKQTSAHQPQDWGAEAAKIEELRRQRLRPQYQAKSVKQRIDECQKLVVAS